MRIASKYEDIYPLKLSVVYEKIAHRKIPTKDIKDFEFKILSELDFEVRKPSQYDFITIFMEQALQPSIKKDKSNSELVEVLVHYVSKMVYHDYSLSQYQPSLLAAASLYVSLKLAERFKKSKKRDKLISTQFMKRLTELSQHSEPRIIDLAKKILSLSQNFDKQHPGLTNLKKTHFNKISRLIDLTGPHDLPR